MAKLIVRKTPDGVEIHLEVSAGYVMILIYMVRALLGLQ